MNLISQKKSILPALTLVAALTILTSGASVARAEGTRIEIEGQPFVLNEFGAMIAEHGRMLEIVLVAMDPENRQAAYRDVDLKAKDQILMINGKGVKTVSDLEAAYNALKPGDNVALAVKRDRDRMMVSFPKGSPDAHGPRFVIRTATDGAGGETAAILGLGILAAESDGKVEVVDILPPPPGHEMKQVFQLGDVIVALQDMPVTSVSDLEKRYDEIAVGDDVAFEVLRDGGKDVFTIAKPEAPQGRMMIKTQQDD